MYFKENVDTLEGELRVETRKRMRIRELNLFAKTGFATNFYVKQRQ